MAHNGYKFIDPDLHVYEPADLWLRYLEPKYRDQAPIGSDEFVGDMYLTHEGRLIARGGMVPMMGELFEDLTAQNERAARMQEFYDRGFGSDVQMEAMDDEGIDIAVMFPTRGFYAMGKEYDDDHLAAAIARAYNDWLVEFCSLDPARMIGVSLIAPQNIDLAIAEVRRIKQELGFKAVYLRPNPVRRRNWHNPVYDPLWEECVKHDLVVAFHEGWPCQLPVAGGDRFDGRHEDLWLTEHVICHPAEMMYATVCMIMAGVLERFPGLRVAFLEANCSWVPYWLWRMDEHYEHREKRVKDKLPRKPSVYFKDHCYVAVEADEHMGPWVAEQIGDDNIVFSTDFPHEDSRYPHAVETFLEMPFSEVSRHKILWHNSARLYGLG